MLPAVPSFQDLSREKATLPMLSTFEQATAEKKKNRCLRSSSRGKRLRPRRLPQTRPSKPAVCGLGDGRHYFLPRRLTCPPTVRREALNLRTVFHHIVPSHALWFGLGWNGRHRQHHETRHAHHKQAKKGTHYREKALPVQSPPEY